MISPIKNQINTIFVHVSDLKQAVKWYSNLLGVEYNLDMVHDPVYNIHINHHTGLTLDGVREIMKRRNPSAYPLFNFHTDDIHKSYQYVKELDCTIDSEIVDFDDFSFFTIKDPDENIIMICTG
ncbi:VOC family protein [Virgibacillus ndiopensis]|uniref:VOC family protein n=1 Tax=Virgibacillus ndiopensis TaxID=2004408 RepID=UPI000C068C63|nr:VOC family protein [Virgibacillus ndiopensis]